MPNKTILTSGAAVALLAGSAALAGVVGPAVRARQEPGYTILLPHHGASLLYDQNEDDAGVAVRAENFESELDAYDTEAADDFTVPSGQTWKISEVFVAGILFEGSRSADSFNVTFYWSRKGKIGKAVKSCLNAGYRFDTPFDFGAEYITCKAKLKSGAYFVAVQANTEFFEGGEWGWLTNSTVRGNPSMWRNPGGGYGTGCTDFAPTTTCYPGEEGGDFAFALYGRASTAGAAD